MFGNFEVSHSVQLLRCYSSDPLLASAGPLRALQRPEADLEGQKKRPGIPGRRDDRYHHSRRYSAPSTHESLKPGLASAYLSLGQCIITRPICQMLPLPSDGDEGIRTPDLLRAREALSHLSYIPPSPFKVQKRRLPPSLVGLRRFELRTPPLSEVCSNQLSYRPSTLTPEK